MGKNFNGPAKKHLSTSWPAGELVKAQKNKLRCSKNRGQPLRRPPEKRTLGYTHEDSRRN